MKKMNKKGFTLMEMLIVIAIIAILIAIAIPTFTAALEKSRQKTDLANARALKSLVVAQYMAADDADSDTPINVRDEIEKLDPKQLTSSYYTFYIAKNGQQLAAANDEEALKVTANWGDYADFTKGHKISAKFNAECTYLGGEPDLLVVS